MVLFVCPIRINVKLQVVIFLFRVDFTPNKSISIVIYRVICQFVVADCEHFALKILPSLALKSKSESYFKVTLNTICKSKTLDELTTNFLSCWRRDERQLSKTKVKEGLMSMWVWLFISREIANVLKTKT